MSYITIDDIPKVLTGKLAKMGLPDDEADLAAEIARHDTLMAGLINSKLAGRYAVPFTAPIPGLVRFVALHLVIHSLFAQQQKIGDEYQEQYERALALLDAMAAGQLPIFDETTGDLLEASTLFDSTYGVTTTAGIDYDYQEDDQRAFPRTLIQPPPLAFPRTYRTA